MDRKIGVYLTDCEPQLSVGGEKGGQKRDFFLHIGSI